LIIGIIHAISISDLSPFWHKAFHGGSLTIIILLWTNAALHSSSLLLQFFLNKESIYIVNQRTLPIFHLLLRIVIVTTSIYLLLLAWGINVMLWITSAGVIGIAVAYASQDTLSSLFAGVAILSDAPYRLNEYLILEDGTRGRVTHIGFRSTRLMTMNDIEIIIPNSTMANAQIINMSGGQTRLARIECIASVAYGSDIDLVRQLLHEIARKVEYVIVDDALYKPKIHFSAMAASSLDFTLRLWIDTPEHILEIEDQVNTLIYKTFQEHNIEIPYTKQDVYLYSMTPTPKESSDS
jgi:small-conductance mechanosensitive channel